MIRLSPKLPRWTAHPAFGVVVLVALAVALIIHGEPQPSSRPSGKSVVVNGSSTVPVDPPAVLLIREGVLEWRQSTTVRRVQLPVGAEARQLLTSHGLAVALALVDGRQHAFAISKNLTVTDLGFADGVIPAVSNGAAVLIETSVVEPGKVYQPAPASSGPPSTTPSSTSSRPGGPPPLRNFLARRYDASGRALGSAFELPPGMRLATDTNVGLVVWHPTSRVFDAGFGQESQSASAVLMRPDGSLREIGPVHPLAADDDSLLVWDVPNRRFGLMPLLYVTSTATTTASPSAPGSAPRLPSATASPSTVAGVKWFDRTRGFVVTGPASFSPDASAFAVYAKVGSRPRLVVAQVANAGTDQIAVLALVQPTVKSSASPTPSDSVATSDSATASPSKSATPTIPAFEPDGFPIPAPQSPQWWNGVAIALGDGLVVGYTPGTTQGSVLDLGVDHIDALTTAS
jgi:hypothetical protein